MVACWTSLVTRTSVTVTKPSRGSLTRFSSASATISWIRSASLRARAVSAIAVVLFLGATRGSDGAVVLRTGQRRHRFPSGVSLVLVVPDPWTGGQQFHLRTTGDQPLAGVEHLPAVRRVGGDQRHPEFGPAVQVEVTGLRRADVEPPAQLGDDRTDHGAFLLQRVNVAE